MSATQIVVVVLVAVALAAGVAALTATLVARARPTGWSTGADSGDPAVRGAEQHVIGARLDQLQGDVRHELERVERLVGALGQRSAEQYGQLDQALRSHAEATRVLSATASGLREVLANPKARGQWGERMADDVLRVAGFVEHVNYRRQTAVSGDGRGLPDYTFFLPKGHVVYMDVKFPMSAYLRHCEATNEVERRAHRDQFLRDVRMRVGELARRDYAAAGDDPAVEQVLLFLPNETIAAFVFEHDPDIIDLALRQRVLLCSPVTLFAYLGLIRQAFDSFMVEQTSDQILGLLGRFGEQWGKYGDSLDVVRRRFDAVQRELDHLTGTRRRALERPLRELEAIRLARGLPLADLDLGAEPVDELTWMG